MGHVTQGVQEYEAPCIYSSCVGYKFTPDLQRGNFITEFVVRVRCVLTCATRACDSVTPPPPVTKYKHDK